MSEELKELAQQLISYYGHHGIEKMIKARPGFVEEDFTKLLTALEKELEQ